MRVQRLIMSVTALLCAVGFLIPGCSKSSPVTPDTDTPEIAIENSGASSNHHLFAEYNVIIRDVLDSAGNTIDVELEVQPLRSSNIHIDIINFLLPPYCSNCLKFSVADFVPGLVESTFTITILALNPFPAITGYDLRLLIQPPIAMCTLDNADGWTELYNEVSPDHRNPYVAFNKETLLRPFAGSETVGTSAILRKNNAYKLLEMVLKLDVSWPSNAEEAVGCWIAPITGPIYPEGSNAWIILAITDWQNDITSVELDLSEFNGGGLIPMIKIDEDPENYTTTWQYLLTEGAGHPAGPRRIWLQVTDPVEPTKYYQAIDVECTYDPDPPVWKNPQEIGIYDHISGPELVWLFYYEAFDVSLPIQYIFWGNDQSSPFDGEQLNVKIEGPGVNVFGETAGAPANVERWFGIRLLDAQGWYDDDMNEYSCTRHSMDARWSRKDSKVGALDGILGSPAIGDVDGDGIDDIVIGSRNHFVFAYRGDGTGNEDTRIWTDPDAGKTDGEIQCTPALVDLNDDGKLDVIVASDDGKIWAFNGADGLPLWTYNAPGDGYLMHATPSIGFLNGDNVPDVIVGSGDGVMIALDGTDGTELWTFPDPGNGIAGTPGLGDVTGDGIVDVFFGAYNTKVYCLNGSTGEKIWDHYVGPALYNVMSAPAIVDVNGDEIPDCIFSAINFVNESIGALIALDGINGEVIWTYSEIWGNPKTGPAAAYIDEDSVIDFLVTATMTEIFSVYAISGATGQTIYKRLSPNVDPDTAFSYTAPIIGDFTADGHLNGMFGREDGFVDLINIGDLDYPGDFGGKILFSAMVSTGSQKQIFGVPAVADVDGDGELELIACNLRGYTYVLDLNAAVSEDILYRAWMQHSGNRWHTGQPYFEPPK